MATMYMGLALTVEPALTIFEGQRSHDRMPREDDVARRCAHKCLARVEQSGGGLDL